MLALPIKYVKDAARSVKRICEHEFKKVKDSVLTWGDENHPQLAHEISASFCSSLITILLNSFLRE
jgi:hypothetical protein